MQIYINYYTKSKTFIKLYEKFFYLSKIIAKHLSLTKKSKIFLEHTNNLYK